MKNIIVMLLLSFTIITTQGRHIYLHASPDMITGTDSACEAYWEELWDYLEIFQYVHILNAEWIPSSHIVNGNNWNRH